MITPAAALAAAPMLVHVGQMNGHLTATWTLPAGVQAQVVEAAQNPATGSDGYFFFENVLAAGTFETLEPNQTTWTETFQEEPGTYFVHVAGLDEPCFYAGACPVREFSQTMPVMIPGSTPPPPPAPPPPPDCVVPNVRGLTLTSARKRIQQSHCSVGVVRRAYSTRVRVGRVIKQSPQRGTALGNRAPVDLVVSRGRRR